ncbi:MAG: cofactor-independent phosphoglycerate mutase [Bacteroidetes bacterium]|nr:cofactor-independent phosphoglycerate mutase [Bacteroidota bacterium]
MKRKYVIVVPDGAADYPIPQLGGKTVFESASTPNLDRLASNGIQGLCYTVPQGMSPGSDVAMMGVLGYDAQKYYSGRAPIEAVAQSIPLSETDWVFRCNLVTIENGVMIDHSAGHLSTEEGCELIQEINRHCGSRDIQFYTGVGYRHLMVVRGKEFGGVATVPPHDNIGKPIDTLLPQGTNAEFLKSIIMKSQEILPHHPVNTTRKENGKRLANSVWLWGEGRKITMESFEEKYGLKGAVITAVDLVKGLARLIGFDVLHVEGATGYFNTNYRGKGEAAIEALKKYDLVVVHIEATDEAGHAGDAETKERALELIDEHIIGPIYNHLLSYASWRMLVMPDHPTPVATRAHVADAVPFALAGDGIEPKKQLPFSEFNAAQSGLLIQRGYELMKYFVSE